jgi:glycosyltransferase involved in cell wall biosynthesis
MKFSLAICTWNRAELLKRTLASIGRLRIPTEWHWQVVVVDNNCTDRTPDVIREFISRMPLRAITEPLQGLSHARNRAIEHCTGQVIVWTDDDVEVPPDWLVKYGEAIDRTPGSSFWGGPIRPKFLSGRPEWLVKNWETCKGCFAARDLGPEPFELTPERLPYGANFAVRTSVQRKFLFDEGLGRKGASLVGDEELDLMQRLMATEHRGFWVPEAGVDHLIPPEKMTLDYVRNYFVGQGRRLPARKKTSNRSRRSLRREAFIQRWLFRIKYRTANSPTWLAHWIRAALAEGEAQGLAEQAASPPR